MECKIERFPKMFAYDSKVHKCIFEDMLAKGQTREAGQTGDPGGSRISDGTCKRESQKMFTRLSKSLM